jgi:hypothetical protein
MTIVSNPFTAEQQADLAASDAEVGLPAGTSAAQIMRESANNAKAVSPAGALGYAQVMPATLASLNKQLGRNLDPTNWDDAMVIHRTLMKQNMQHFGNVADALAAYNSGWDRSKWGNPETQAYVAALAGGASVSAPKSAVGAGDPNADQMDNPLVPHFKGNSASAGMTPIQKELAMREQSAGNVAALNQTMNSTQSARPDLDTSLYPQIGEESAQAVAQETHQASLRDSLVEGFMWNSITGRMVDHFQQDAADPNFKWDQKMVSAFAQQHPDIYANDEMREYVLGSDSEKNMSLRLGEAAMHLDFQQRYKNTEGLAGAGDFLINQIGAMADPVTLVATMGLGAGVAVARGGVEASLLARTAQGMGEGALVNVGLGKGISSMDNQEFGWKDVVGQAVAGAALGALTGLLPHKAKLKETDAGAKLDGIDQLHDGATKTANDVINNMTDREITDLKDGGKDGGILDPHNSDHNKVMTDTEGNSRPNDVQDAIDRVKADEERAKADEGFKEVEKDGDTVKVDKDGNAEVEKADKDLAKDVNPGVEDRVKDEETVPLWNVGGGNENRRPHGKWLTSAQKDAVAAGKVETNTAMAELTRIANSTNGIESGLARRLIETVNETGAKVLWHEGKGRAFYNPSTHEVHMFKIGLDGKAREDRIVLHEVTHSVTQMKLAFGKAHPESVHGQLYSQLEKVRQKALREFNKALKSDTSSNSLSKAQAETKYYLKNADEFVAGLFSNHPHFIEHLKSLKPVKGAGNLLSKTLDIIRTLIGLKPEETNLLTQAMGITDHVIDSRLKTRFRYQDGSHLDVLGEAAGSRHDIPLGPLAQGVEKSLLGLVEKGDPAELAKVRERGLRWYNDWRGKTGLGRALGALDSVGLKLATSDNDMVRAVANLLCEDATGINRRGGTSAAIDKVVMASNWRTPMVNAWNTALEQLLTPNERAKAMMGGANDALKRIGKQVQEERLQHRNARANNTEYVSQAHPAIKQLAAAMDGMFKDIAETGARAQEEKTSRIIKSGWQGYMPYRFDDSALRQLYRDAATNPERAQEWNNLISNFRSQYVSKLTDPIRNKMLKAGPVEERELLKNITEMAEKRTDDYFTQIMREQGDRVLGADDHFANVAAKMLEDVKALKGRKATRLTQDLIDNFRKDLADVISDKSRTEFDLLHRVNGVRMLDYMDTDFGRMVEQNTSHYAGAIALAKRGVKDEAHWSAFKDVLARHGAKDEDLSNLDFVFKALSDEHHAKDNAAATMLQSATSLALMGKVGLNAFGDAGALVGAVGVGGFFKALAGSFAKRSGLMEQLERSATSALGMDHRLKFHDTTDGVQVRAKSLMDSPAYRNTVGTLGKALSWMSLVRPVQIATHRAAVPAVTEELISAIRGAKFDEAGKLISTGSGTLNPARLVDTGLTSDRVRAIQELLATHDAGRKAGDRINWGDWDRTNPGYAEDFIGAIHRVTSQVLQRAYVGETPRWATETQMGRFITQFRNQGLVGAEKQFGRNMAHADRVTMAQFGFNTAWATGLYWAKTMASTAGMDDAKRDKYLSDAFSGERLGAGIAAMTNVSGIASDALDLVNIMTGGQSSGNSPFASMGYLSMVGGAANKVAKAASGDVNTDAGKATAGVLRTLPLSNTFIGSALVNGIQ